VQALMKGALHTNELMAAIVARNTGLRTDRRMSHVFVMQTPAYPKYLLISDGALNIAPDLHTKRWIVQNAIDVANAIGIDSPKTAILAATEEVDPHMPSTVDAAALCKMAERGQIIGGVLDGPLAFDLAVSKQAVKIKGLASDVAGDADILIVPNIEAGNMLAKQLDYLAGAAAAGLVVGARVPIILTSRSDSVTERLASCALAKCYLVWKDGTS
jgi:phosphate acetyltransferase